MKKIIILGCLLTSYLQASPEKSEFATKKELDEIVDIISEISNEVTSKDTNYKFDDIYKKIENIKNHLGTIEEGVLAYGTENFKKFIESKYSSLAQNSAQNAKKEILHTLKKDSEDIKKEITEEISKNIIRIFENKTINIKESLLQEIENNNLKTMGFVDGITNRLETLEKQKEEKQKKIPLEIRENSSEQSLNEKYLAGELNAQNEKIGTLEKQLGALEDHLSRMSLPNNSQKINQDKELELSDVMEDLSTIEEGSTTTESNSLGKSFGKSFLGENSMEEKEMLMKEIGQYLLSNKITHTPEEIKNIIKDYEKNKPSFMKSAGNFLTKGFGKLKNIFR